VTCVGTQENLTQGSHRVRLKAVTRLERDRVRRLDARQAREAHRPVEGDRLSHLRQSCLELSQYQDSHPKKVRRRAVAKRVSRLDARQAREAREAHDPVEGGCAQRTNRLRQSCLELSQT
jgi:hypothetical protein